MRKDNKQDKKTGERRTLLEYLTVTGDVGGDSLAGDIYLEMRGKNSLLVKGCRRILQYSPERIVLEVRKETLTIEGKRLVCTSYHSGSIGIEGVIFSLSFETEEKE